LHEKELYHALDASQMLFMANRASDRNFTREYEDRYWATQLLGPLSKFV